MAKDRSLVRASDIGAWTFCRRAWWLANVKQVAHRNPAVLQAGESAHEAHGRQVVRSARLQRVGFTLAVIGVLLIVVFLLWWMGPG